MHCLSKNNLVNRGYCLLQLGLNGFILPCGRSRPKHKILYFPPSEANAKALPRKPNAEIPPSKANTKAAPNAMQQRTRKPNEPQDQPKTPMPRTRFPNQRAPPCDQLRCRSRDRCSTLLRPAGPMARLLPLPQDLGAAVPSDKTKPRVPLRPIDSPRPL